MRQQKIPTKWNDEFYVTVYEYARSGKNKAQIAKLLNISIMCFYLWWKKRSAFRNAYKRGRRQKIGVATFREYVYNRLPKHLKEIWNKINACEMKRNGVERMEAILQDAGKKARQHLFLYAYTTCGFNASEACRCVNIARQVYEGWYKNDPDFHELFDEMEFHKKNYMEGAMMDLVAERNPHAVIFVNRTYNADRGYGDKLKVEHSGKITHEHKVVPIKDLNLEHDLKVALLEAIRDRNTKHLEHNGHANGS